MPDNMPMTFAEAARLQHRYGSFYTVWLVDADGTRRYLGCSQRKSGTGLLKFIGRERVQEVFKAMPGAETLEWTKKTADALHLNNGMKVTFGGTIRQEAGEGV
jgi:hypothetical protein